MATLAISSAANVGVGLALNALFPADDDSEIENVKITGSTYGTFVNFLWGTKRLSGTVIYAEEIVTRDDDGLFKGGGILGGDLPRNDIPIMDVSFGVSGFSDWLQIFFDGTLVADKTGTAEVESADFTVAFYPGGPTQEPDPAEVASLGLENTPAYGHLTRLVFTNLKVNDFGNRPPNVTAVFTTNPTANVPFTDLEEVAGMDIPGSLAGGATDHMAVDTERNLYVSLKENDGLWVADLAEQTVTVAPLFMESFSDAGYGDGFIYAQDGLTNSAVLRKVDAQSGIVVDSFGSGSAGLADTTIRVGNSGNFTHVRDGPKSYVVHINAASGFGSVLDADDMTHVALLGSPLLSSSGYTIPDNDRGEAYIVVGSGSVIQVSRVTFLSAGVSSDVTVTEIGQLARGSPGDPFETGGNPDGWAIHTPTGYLLISNGGWTVVYDPATDTVVANRAIAFRGRNNFISGNVFAYTDGTSGTGNIFVIDPLTLETLNTIDLGSFGLTGNEATHEPSNVWESVSESLIFSRAETGSTASVDNRVVRVYVTRNIGGPELLSDIMTDLCTVKENIPLANLDPADFDTTPLVSSLTVQGMALESRKQLKSVVNVLRSAFFFDMFPSDWIVKFALRGQSSLVQIPEDDIGMFRENADSVSSFPREVAVLESQLPRRQSVEFYNFELDYERDTESAKRHLAPVATTNSRRENSLDIPLVFLDGDEPKKIAERTLYAKHNESTTLETELPWQYIWLDPSDVFEAVLFGEVLTLRLMQEDIGAGLTLGITAARTGAHNYVSTAVAGASLGKRRKVAGVGGPTKLILLDAPNLNIADLPLTQFSAATAAMAGYETNWPGGGSYDSPDNANFTKTGVARRDAAWGFVETKPGAWRRDDNRIQESAEGGSMIINPKRRYADFASVTRLDVLNGANTIAVITSSGVEILQFTNVTVNADATLTISDLHRGRLGTDDVVDADTVAAGDVFVLLSDSAGAEQLNSLTKQNLSLTALNVERFYKGVTLGRTPELVTATEAFTYTGRDTLPYSVAHLSAVFNAGDVVVDWVRRAWGAKAGPWLNGTGLVPLNLGIERYEVTVDDGSSSVLKTVDDATGVTFTAAEISGLTPPLNATVQQLSGINTAAKSPPRVVPVV